MQIAAVPPPTPGAGMYNKRGMDLLQLPGVRSLSWGMADPDALDVNVTSEQDAAFLKALLEPVVEGVRLIVKLEGKEWTGTPAAYVSDLLRAVSALPGVWDIDKRGISAIGGRVTIKTINQASIDRLDPLLVDRLDFGTRPRACSAGCA